MEVGKFLVADDDEDIRTSFSRILAGAGHAVDTAASGDAVLEKVRETTYDLVFVEVHATSCGGMEVGACDIDLEWKVGDGEWQSRSGPKNAGGVTLDLPLMQNVPPDAILEGFDVSLTDRDPFVDDDLGSCHVDPGKEHLVAAFRKKGAPDSEQSCGKSSNTVVFRVELNPSYAP